MSDHLHPADEAELAEAVAQAAVRGTRLEICGGGSKRPVGREVAATTLSIARLAGIVDYDPAELVLTVRAGTPLAEVEALLAEAGQMLAFEPFDHGPLFGAAAGTATIGGVVAAGAAGSRRLTAGSARDHLLGFRAVSGRGEAFVAGAKVVKNVTGYDLPKLAAGSWGRLFALAELSLKVLPRPETARTLVAHGLEGALLSAAMAAAMGSRALPAAVAHLPAATPGALGVTAFRLEGFGPSVAARTETLRAALREHATLDLLHESEAEPLWTSLRSLASLPPEPPLWRINIPPRGLDAVLDALRVHDAHWLADWAGGLVWAACDAPGEDLRQTVAAAGGHAMLMRAPAGMRAVVPTFHPQPPILSGLEERVRRAFDPLGLFETERF